MRLHRLLLCVLLLLAGMAPAHADSVQSAFNDALAAFEQARPQLGSIALGVDVAAYGDALARGQFASAHWGGNIAVSLEQGQEGAGSCGRYAAFVRLPPQNGTITLVTCPQFSAEGTDALRRLTVLHEMVHVVAGNSECQAMAFAARVEWLGLGHYTPVDRYWRDNDCEASGYALP